MRRTSSGFLKENGPSPRLICVDGVNSMTGNAVDLPAFARLARAYDALLYVDDAHGFGVIGERSDDELSPYGNRGNSIVRHTGETYDNVVLVSGLSKAYSSLAAFLTCSAGAEAPAEDRRSAVSLFRPVSDRVPRDRARRPGREREAR